MSEPAAVSDSRPGNLPSPTSSFIGREREITQVKQLLSQTRMLTLTGSGGCGKTRLALRVAADLLDAHADGVWLVELAGLVDPSLGSQVVAAALDVEEEPGRPVIETLEQALSRRNLLLIWDDCERLTEACGLLTERLLRACPGLRILATSRGPVGAEDETAWRVPSLSLPDLQRLPPLEELTRLDSVRLFGERAAEVVPNFAVTDENALTVARICHRLDGMPLAIELAAAQVMLQPVEEIAAQLDAHFRRLTEDSEMALPRYQTMRAALDWAYDRLSDDEQTLLRRLSVFAGGWTLDSAEAVIADQNAESQEQEEADTEAPPSPSDLLDLLNRLVDRALILTDEQDVEARYWMLPTVRQYSRGRLVESGELETMRRRHRDYFLGLAEKAGPRLPDVGKSPWLDRLDAERDNLRAALEWCQVEEGSLEEGLRLVGALARYWYVRRHFEEGFGWLEAMLERSQDVRSAARARALSGAGLLARGQGDFARAHSLYEECLEIQRELGDKREIARTLNNLGVVAGEQGEYKLAESLFEEGLAIQRELKDRRGIARTLNNLGVIAHDRGDYDAARALYEEYLALERGLKDRRGIALALDNLGLVTYRQGDYATARALFEECLAIRRELREEQDIAQPLNNLGLVAYHQGDYAAARAYFRECLELRRRSGREADIAECLEGFAGLITAEGQAWRAARLYGAAEALRESVGVPMPPYESEEYESNVAAIRLALGEEAFAREWEKGRTLSIEQALEHALAE